MEDKMFDLMTKFYDDFSEFRKDSTRRFDSLETRMGSMETQIHSISNTVIRIEQEHGAKIEAALDGYKLVYEKLQEHDRRFDALEEKMQKQDVEIRVIKGGNAV